MDYDGGFILQKDVNWTLLTEGQKFGDEYGYSVVEAHHIDYFIPASFTRTIRGSIVRSFSSSSRMARC